MTGNLTTVAVCTVLYHVTSSYWLLQLARRLAGFAYPNWTVGLCFVVALAASYWLVLSSPAGACAVGAPELAPTGLTNNVPVAWEAVPLDVISAHLAARLARS